ncbi:FtsQ-type POTRA domain-containing protein [Endozoicomonas sp. SM1973]|uniref:Cell division protein FtsQ n=1 Tax=Spartinivicinus marinus TaxID=2994442 RepID=A0A853HWM6_9GAMM|nr:cell division protein FtsQ/DivIB [Spartinivicinus marinus]MCX4028318.1 cell division protein FtsQ/DivIB [Spartinivicinus marinus]NYZ65653.1 FtsQ-type POTRA domain-containing protein [Spartinivicinus marinus]
MMYPVRLRDNNGINRKQAKRRGASKKKQTQKKSIKWSRLLGSFLKLSLVACFIGLGVWCWPKLTDYFNQPVKRVQVEGQFAALQKASVQQLVEPYLSSRFFNIDLIGLQTDLEKIPWIETVALRRVWPDQIQVKIVEHIAVARWNDDELLSNKGNRFKPEKLTGLKSLPKLTGPVGTEQQVMAQYHKIAQLIRPLGMSIKQLNVSSRGALVFVTDHFRVLVGRDDVVKKIQRFVKVYKAQLVGKKELIKSVDVRYSSGVAVMWKTSELKS